MPATATKKKAAEPDHSAQSMIHIYLSNRMIEEVEDFRYRNRFPSRTEAFRKIVRLGLDADKQHKK